MMDNIKLYDLESECCGCSACLAICPKNAIRFIENQEGFLYPVIEEDLCIGCKQCIQVCPLKNDSDDKKDNGINKAAIICLSYTENYGARIVAWALQNKVKQLLGENSEVSIIEYQGEESWSASEEFNPFVILKRAKSYIKTKLRAKRYDSKNNISEVQRKERTERFKEFNDKYLNICLKTNRILPFKHYVETQNAIIVGSDIVFRPEFASKFSDVYFLGCMKNSDKDIIKLSYAASIATNDKKILEDCKEYYKNGIENFDYLSTREKSSQVFLSELTTKPVSYCCDPVLLYTEDEFNFIKKAPNENDGYIYINLLGPSKSAVNFAKKIAKENALSINYYCDVELIDEKNAENVYSDGPIEFIERIKNAEYIVTNSFHTAVFSILFHKKFYVSFRKGQNCKLDDLLTALGLQNRVISADYLRNTEEEIDWNSVDSKLETFRNDSINYLKTSLGKLIDKNS